MSSKRCEACGGEFPVARWNAARRFCSIACKGRASRNPPKACVICGAEFPGVNKRQRTCSLACGSALQVQLKRKPWRVGSRPLLARTCGICGTFLQAEAFPRSGDGTHSHTCTACSRAAMSPEQRARANERGRDSDSHIQAASTPGASRHGYQWTGPELEIALRADLSLRDAAAMLGRTYYAVQAARHKARTDPKWIQVAG